MFIASGHGAKAREVYEVGLPRLLDVYAKTDIRCTFYFTGKMVEMVPEAVEVRKLLKCPIQ
jgi:peptidoglycan/xylan/chitin deacetylase (PgdA/CDA1 family)